jgi:transposase
MILFTVGYIVICIITIFLYLFIQYVLKKPCNDKKQKYDYELVIIRKETITIQHVSDGELIIDTCGVYHG